MPTSLTNLRPLPVRLDSSALLAALIKEPPVYVFQLAPKPEPRPRLPELAPLIDLLAPILLEKLAAAPQKYTTKSPPPGVTRRTFNEWCLAGKVPGALKHGRVWSCTVDQWEAARAVRVARKSPVDPKPSVAAEDEQIVRNAIAKSFRTPTC